MAHPTQNGTTRSSQVSPSLPNHALFEKRSNGRIFVAGREATIGLSSDSLEHEKYGALPGVSEERRFHGHNPEVLVPNELLRSGLREDYHLGTSLSSSFTTSSTNHIARGHARGEQYRLYKAIAVVSSTASENLQCALMVETSHQFRQNGTTSHGVHWRVNSDTLSTHRYTASIQDVSSCEGADSSFFVLRTTHAVEIISLDIVRFDKVASIQVKSILSIDHRFLAGQNPTTCNLSYDGALRLILLTADGSLRVWKSQDISPRSQQFPKLVLTEIYATSQLAVFKILPILNTELQSRILLIGPRDIHVANLVEKTIKKVYSLEATETISAFTSVVNTPGEESCYALATNLQLISIVLHGNTFAVRMAWQHHFKVDESVNLQGAVLDDTVFLFMYSSKFPLCQVFSYVQRATGLEPCNRQRIIFDHNNAATAVLPYVCKSETTADRRMLGILYVSQKGLLCNMLLSTMLVEDMTIMKVQNKVGPAIIQDEEDDYELRKHWGEYMSDEDRIRLDLSSWYEHLIKRDTAELQKAKQSEQQSSPRLQLASEKLNYLDKLDNVDSQMEAMVHACQDSGRYANTTYGLRLYEVDELDADEESNSVYHLERMMNAWRGGARFQHKRLTAESMPFENDQIKVAARSLALSTVVISDRIPRDLEQLSFSEICTGVIHDGRSKNVARILEDWNTSAEPEAYRWHDTSAGQSALTTSQGIVIPEIPAYVGTRNVMPPVVASSQAAPPLFSATQGAPMSSQVETGFAATQPVSGKFGDKKKAVNKAKRLRAAGF